jgi:hypothetical protein
MLYSPGDSERHVQTSQFVMVAEPAFADNLHLGAALVVAQGTLAPAIDWD